MSTEGPLTRAELKERVARMLLEELRVGQYGWYYISMASETGEGFKGGFVLRAAGPTDAWRLFHSLGWWEEGCSTMTHGPITDEVMARVPEGQRWRKLSRDEAKNLGK